MTLDQIVRRVSISVGDTRFKRFSKATMESVINRGYARTTAKVGAFQKSTPFPFMDDTPYYNFRKWIPNFYSLNGIYNFKVGEWIHFMSEKDLNLLRWDWERWTGDGTRVGIILDWYRIGLFPYNTLGTGTFLLWHNSFPTPLEKLDEPVLPEGFHTMLVDWGAAELLASEKEFTKARTFYKNYYSQYDGLEEEVNQVAKYDKDLVLEPYLPLNRYGGQTDKMQFVDDIIPSGPINGVNPDFDLPQAPNPSSSLELFKNGQLLAQGIAYTLIGKNIHFMAPYIPQGGPFTESDDILRAFFRVL